MKPTRLSRKRRSPGDGSRRSSASNTLGQTAQPPHFELLGIKETLARAEHERKTGGIITSYSDVPPEWRRLWQAVKGRSLLPTGKRTSVTSVTASGANGSAAAEPPDWDTPIPLGPPPPPGLPLDGLPPWLREYIEAVAEATATPPDMALLLGLTAISTAVANKGRVVVKEGYTEPLIIWTVTVAAPGARKSPVFGHMMQPIKEYEAEEAAEYRIRLGESEVERSVLAGAIKEATKTAKTALLAGEGYEDAIKNVKHFKAELEEVQGPAADLITTSDITPERLAQSMGEHFGRAAIVSPEGDIFKIMSGLYSDRQINLQIFKIGWTGDEPFTDDRISRQGSRVARPALVIGLTVQPIVLANLRGKDQFRGEGVLGRFLYAQPDDNIGYRLTGDDVPPLNKDARQRYAECLGVLLAAGPLAVVGPDWTPHELALSTEAAGLRNNFAAEVEHSLRPGEDLDGSEDWGAKLTGSMVRVAGLIHLAWQVEEGKELWGDPISGQAMETAVNLGRALIPHVRRVFDEMDVIPEVHVARYVLRRISTYEGDEPLTVRELHRRCQGSKEIQQVDDLDQPLRLLEEHRFIRRTKQGSTGGRRPSPIIELNPHARDSSDKSDRSRHELREELARALEGVLEESK